MKVWKAITDLTEEENDMIAEIFSDEDAATIYDLDAKGEVYGYDEIVNGNIVPYLICTEEVIEIISEICTKYEIKFGPVDITEDFLIGLYPIPDSDFERFREENLTEDLVYKKLRRFGADSLDAVDKLILEQSI